MSAAHIRIESRLPDRPIIAGIVASRYNGWIIDTMRTGALEEFQRRSPEHSVCLQLDVPGAFELPVAARWLARRSEVDLVVCLGCLIKGETSHDRVIADAVAEALQRVALDSGKPVGFGVLTVDTAEQAEARAGGAMGNKGSEAMAAALEMLAARQALGALSRDEVVEAGGIHGHTA